MSYEPRRMNGEDPYKRMRREYEEEGRMSRNTNTNKRTNSKNNGKGKKKQRITTQDTFFRILAVIFVAITLIFYIAILKLNMLPANYLAIFTIVEIIFTLLVVVGLAKKKKTYKLNVFFLIIAILASAIYIYVTNYANATTNFLGSMFKEVQETEEYYVVVNKSSEYESIEDIDGKEVHTFQLEEDVKTDVENNVDVTFETENNLTQLGNDLLVNNVDAILVSSSQYDILSEEIETFEPNTRIIFTAHHAIEKVADINDSNSKYKINNGVFNVYISGMDTSGNISNVSRSDANILATINTNTHEVLLTSIPRDYYVTLHGKGAKDKLTHSGIYGINETITTVEDLLDIDINYYVRVNFTTVIKLVDTLGGVEVYSDYAFNAQGYSFSKGYNYLNGEEALAFSRERHSFASGDNQRVKNQQAVIEAIMKKVLNSKTILTSYTDILESLEGSFQTNIDQDEISNLVKDQLNNMSSWSIETNALTGTGGYEPTYSMGSLQSYVMYPDESSVENAKQEINALLEK